MNIEDDYLSYYSVDNRFFKNKLQALIYATLKTAPGLLSITSNTVDTTTTVVRTWNSFQDYQNFFSNTNNQILYFNATFDRVQNYLQTETTSLLSYSSN